MRSALLTTAAFALTAITTSPAIADTWVTYHEQRASDNTLNYHIRHEIDAASIVRHNGVIYANERFCTSRKSMIDTYPCRNARLNTPAFVRQASAQCRKGILQIHTLRYTRRNGNEWWTDIDIDYGRDGTAGVKENDVQNGAAFKFLCG